MWRTNERNIPRFLSLPDVEVASLLDQRAVDGLRVLVWHVDAVIHRQKLPLGPAHQLRLRVQLGLDAAQDQAGLSTQNFGKV